MENKKEIIERDLDELHGTQKLRIRPSVMLGSDGIRGVQQTLFEIITNSIDRWKVGYGDRIIITRYEDDSYTIQDFADGIPVHWNEKNKAYSWDTALCTLYGGDNYKQSDELSGKLGFFGLGLASTEYTSEYMKVVIRKPDNKYTLNFKEGRGVDKYTGEFVKDDDDFHYNKEQADRIMLIEENNDKITGTTITYKPDKRVFTDIEVDSEWIQNKLQKQAMINGGITIVFNDKKINQNFTYCYNKTSEYIKDVIKDGYISNFIEFEKSGEGQDRKDMPMYKVSYNISLAFNNNNSIQEYYHNSSELTDLKYNVTTKAVEKALTTSIDCYLTKNNLYKKKESIKFDDIKDSIDFILCSKSTKTSYANQTKLSIDNVFIKDFIYEDLKTQLDAFLIENTKEAEKIIKQILLNMRARLRADEARKGKKSNSSNKNRLEVSSQKLSICTSKNKKEKEFIVVEGDSGAGSARGGGFKKFQSVEATKGKIPNAIKSKPENIINNEEIRIFTEEFGLDFNKYDEDKLRYDKLIIMSDAD